MTREIIYASLLVLVTVCVLPGCSESVTRITASDARDVQPAVSPDGSRIAFVSNRGGTWQVWIMSADGNDSRQLTDMPVAVGRPVFEPDGTHVLFYAGKDEEWAVYRLPVVDDDAPSAAPEPFTPLTSGFSEYRPDPSADGRWIVFDRWGDSDPPNHDIHLLETSNGSVRRLTSSPAYDSDARISPDGSRVVFHSDRDGDEAYELQVYMMNRDGSGLQRLTDGPDHHAYPAWCPDGRHVVYSIDGADGSRIGELDLETGRETILISGAGAFYSPTYTPDGRSVVFSTDRFSESAEDLASIPSRRCGGPDQTSR